jgi:hypothetical protein
LSIYREFGQNAVSAIALMSEEIEMENLAAARRTRSPIPGLERSSLKLDGVNVSRIRGAHYQLSNRSAGRSTADICLIIHLVAVNFRSLSHAGRIVSFGRCDESHYDVLSRGEDWVIQYGSPFDCIIFEVAADEIHWPNDGSRDCHPRQLPFNGEDPVFRSLAMSMVAKLNSFDPNSRLFNEQIITALLSHLAIVLSDAHESS